MISNERCLIREQKFIFEIILLKSLIMRQKYFKECLIPSSTCIKVFMYLCPYKYIKIVLLKPLGNIGKTEKQKFSQIYT